MADRHEEVVRNDRAGGVAAAVIAVIALIVALIALWLGWVAYDRTGGDLDERIQQQVEETVNTLDAGPDGIDDDDTDSGTGTDTTQPDTTDGTTDTTEPDTTDGTTDSTDGTTQQQQ